MLLCAPACVCGLQCLINFHMLFLPPHWSTENITGCFFSASENMYGPVPSYLKIEFFSVLSNLIIIQIENLAYLNHLTCGWFIQSPVFNQKFSVFNCCWTYILFTCKHLFRLIGTNAASVVTWIVIIKFTLLCCTDCITAVLVTKQQRKLNNCSAFYFPQSRNTGRRVVEVDERGTEQLLAVLTVMAQLVLITIQLNVLLVLSVSSFCKSTDSFMSLCLCCGDFSGSWLNNT